MAKAVPSFIKPQDKRPDVEHRGKLTAAQSERLRMTAEAADSDPWYILGCLIDTHLSTEDELKKALTVDPPVEDKPAKGSKAVPLDTNKSTAAA